MIAKEINLTDKYEKLRRKMLMNGNKIENQSQLVFLTQGMGSWLKTIKEIKLQSCGLSCRQTATPSITVDLKQTAVAVLTDMILKVVKEEQAC